MLILAGLAVSSLRAMALSLCGALLALLVALTLGASLYSIDAGFYAFSAVLTAVALGSVFSASGRQAWLFLPAGVVFSVLLQGALRTLLEPFGIPPLTIPFVITCWLFLLAGQEEMPAEW